MRRIGLASALRGGPHAWMASTSTAHARIILRNGAMVKRLARLGAMLNRLSRLGAKVKRLGRLGRPSLGTWWALVFIGLAGLTGLAWWATDRLDEWAPNI